MAVSITQVANPAGVSAASNIATYSTVSIGAAAANRIIAVLVATELASSTPSACTIDYGSGDTAMTAGTGGNFGAVYTQIYYLLVPTGTTATIKVTFSSTNPNNTQNHIAVYRVIGADDTLSAQGSDGSTDMDSTDPLTTGSTTIPTGGALLAVAGGATDTTGKSWSNATEDLDVDAGAFRFCTAMHLVEGTATRTCTGGTNGEDGALSYIIFAASASPTVALSSPADAGNTTDTTPDLVFTGTDGESDDVRYQVQIDTDSSFPLTKTNGLDFDGSTQYARRANASTVNDNFTVSLWVKINSYPGVNNAQFFQNGVHDARGFSIYVDTTGELHADFAFVVDLDSNTILSVGTWYHIVLKRELGVARFYVNGVAVGNTTTSSPNSSGSGDYITLGAYTNSGGTTSRFCDCTMDDVRLYERALSWEEIYTLYDNGYIYPNTDISNTSLKYWYKLDETSGTNVDDATATNYDLTTTGSPTWTTGIVPSASSIDVFVTSGTDAGFSGSPDNSDPFASAQAVTYTVQSALPLGTYYWRARAKDPSGSNVYGAWATTRSFTISSAFVPRMGFVDHMNPGIV